MRSVKVNLGIVGATGVVGEEFLKLIEERNFPFGELKLFASEKSVGLTRKCGAREFIVQNLSPGCFHDLDIVFFSSGDEVSREWVPRAVQEGAFAIDNSAAFRMDEKVALIVPEVNPQDMPPKEIPSIIANPNCSTIQLVLALQPLASDFGLHQVRVSTYQAVSGAGRPAQQELIGQNQSLTPAMNSNMKSQLDNLPPPQNFSDVIAYNCIPQVGSFSNDGFCSEERKIRFESRKILGLPHLKISAWTVRVPSFNVHAETAWVTFERAANRQEVLKSLQSQAGLKVVEGEEQYVTPLRANGTDPVFVGRIHQDPDDPKTWMFWIVADNLRKGAALNGIQIAEMLLN